MRAGRSERPVRQFPHRGPVERTQAGRTHVRLDEGRAELYYGSAVLDELRAADLEARVLGLRLVEAGIKNDLKGAFLLCIFLRL